MKSRLARLEKATGALDGGRCPVCAGRNGQGFNARIWTKEGDEPAVLQRKSPFYDDNGFCVRCGARANDIVICYAGLPQDDVRTSRQ